MVSAVWSWLPSFLNRVHGVAPDAGRPSRPRWSCCAARVGSVVWGAVVDRAGARAAARQAARDGAAVPRVDGGAGVRLRRAALGLALSPQAQFALIALGGFLMTCTVGPVSAIVIDVIHPGVRATGASVLALFQNLFGLAAGPFIAGVLSDAWGLKPALAVMPAFGVLAALGASCCAARSYEADRRRAADAARSPRPPPAQPALA